MTSYPDHPADASTAVDVLVKQVVGVLAEILEIDAPPADEPFHRLGGTSIAAAVTLATLWDQTGVRLPSDALGPNGTARTVALRLRQAVTGGGAP